MALGQIRERLGVVFLNGGHLFHRGLPSELVTTRILERGRLLVHYKHEFAIHVPISKPRSDR